MTAASTGTISRWGGCAGGDRSAGGGAALGALAGGRVSLDSVAVTDELIRLARWLEAQPWNRPGSDKVWVLRCADSFREFAAARKRARAVAR